MTKRFTDLEIYKRETLREIRADRWVLADHAFYNYRQSGGTMSFASLKRLAGNKQKKLARALGYKSK